MIDVYYDNSKLSVPPEYKTPDAAGCDIHCAESVTIPVGQAGVIKTHLHMACPPTHFPFLKERSSLAGRKLFIMGGIGDSDYRGEYQIHLFNAGEHPATILAGDRVANCIFIRYDQARFLGVSTLPTSVRGEGGFGSTGR